MQLIVILLAGKGIHVCSFQSHVCLFILARTVNPTILPNTNRTLEFDLAEEAAFLEKPSRLAPVVL